MLVEDFLRLPAPSGYSTNNRARRRMYIQSSASRKIARAIRMNTSKWKFFGVNDYHQFNEEGD